MTASACRSTPSGWSAAGSFGRRPRPVSFRSRCRNSLICWTESIGEIPSTRGVRRWRAELRRVDSGDGIYRTNQRDCAAVAVMAGAADHLPEDTAALIETRAKLVGAEALIEHLQLVIAKMKREMFGPRSERSQRLIDQLELQLEELSAAAGEDETKAETAHVHVQGFMW